MFHVHGFIDGHMGHMCYVVAGNNLQDQCTRGYATTGNTDEHSGTFRNIKKLLIMVANKCVKLNFQKLN